MLSRILRHYDGERLQGIPRFSCLRPARRALPCAWVCENDWLGDRGLPKR